MPEFAVRGRPRVSMSAAIRYAALLAGMLVVVVGWCLFLTPIHLTVRHDADWTIQLLVDGQQQKLATYPVVSRHRVTITNISGDASTVELALPIPDGEPRLRRDQLSSVAGQWTSTSEGERVESTQPGSEITLVLNAAEPDIPFLDRPDGGRVRLRYDGGEQEIDLKRDSPGWHPVRLPPRQIDSVATLRSRPLGASFEVRATGAPAGAAAGAIGFGAREVIRKFEISANNPVSFDLPPSEIVQLVFAGIMDFGVALAMSAVLILALTLAGASLVAADTHVAFRSKWIACFAVGFALFALIANTSAYFFSANDSALALAGLLLAAVAVAVAVGAARRAHRSDAEPMEASRQRLPVPVLAATALGLWLSFWPLTFVGAGFLGALQMDSSFYVTASNAIQSKALFAAISTEGLIGNGMRSIDLALAASLSSISGLTTGRVWLVMCMTLMIVTPLASYYLVRDWLQNSTVAMLTSVCVALSAPFASLFFESYLVQYVTTAALYLNLYTALPFIRSLAHPSPTVRTSFAHALTSALAVLLYPYFAIVPVATVGIAVWLLRKQRVSLVRHVGLLVAMGLAVGNIGYFFMFNHAATGQFVNDLNAIARHIVFPFYNQPRFPAFVFGLAPFHASSEVVGSLVADTAANPLLTWLLGYLSLVERRAVVPVLMAIGAAYLLSLAAERKALLDGFGKLLAASLMGYLLMLIVARHSSGLYAQCKLAWTLATLIPVVIVPALSLCAARGGMVDQAGLRQRGLLRLLAIGTLALFLTGNLISKAAAPMLWFPNPSTFKRANASIATDLEMLDGWQPSSIKSGSRFAFAEVTFRTSPPSQPSQVLAGHVYSALVGRGLACDNCNFSDKLLQFMWFEPLQTRAVNVDMVVVLGDRPKADIRGWSLALTGEQLSIYVRQAQ